MEAHLSGLKRQGLISAWHDRRIIAGSGFDEEISSYLEQADIILFLVSAYFIDSEYCCGIEMTRAIEKHAEGSAQVIPVILRPCDWHGLPFGKLLAVSKDGKPVTKFPDHHEAFAEVGSAVRKVVEALNKKKSRDAIEPQASPAVRSSSNRRMVVAAPFKSAKRLWACAAWR